MEKTRSAAEKARLKDGVFQPGKAEIAKEMKVRLELNEAGEGEREQATASRH